MSDSITPLQIRLAKAALGLSNPALSEATGLNRNTINAAEKVGGNPSRSTRIQLRQYFEGQGVIFVPKNGGPEGIRFAEEGLGPDTKGKGND
ncbi:hypothetical protein J3456_14060 [Sulfitobacter sp. NFXS29]|uniref:helix-turn-helix domain-containing protein n=1 Tax=Sulfitobacter sp. NFXS29 TaxID=2818438 RepID=UPI0032DF0384